MAQTFGGGFFTITAVGVTQATSGTSASVAIPNDSSGNRPNYIRVTSSNETFIKLGLAAVTATPNDALVQPADSVVLQVPKGITHIAGIQGAGGAGRFNVVPLESS
jgi:hypothetical protein